MEIRMRTSARPPTKTPIAVQPAAPTLLARPAGFALMQACLAAYAGDSRRSRLESLLGIRPLRQHAQRLFDRVLVDEAVGTELRRLPSDWTLLHSVPLDGGRVAPHVLVGPPGVFVVAASPARGGSVWISGEIVSVNGAASGEPYVAEHAAAVVERRLAAVLPPGTEVRGLVAVVEPARFVVRAEAVGVRVLPADGVVGWLRSLPEICSALQVDRIADAAILPGTWVASGDDADAVAPDVQRFERLRAETALADARWRRTVRMLSLAGLVLVLGSIAAITALALSAFAA